MTGARIAAELAAAAAARAAGHAGRARVCARRAAGWAVREHYRRLEGPAWSGDALKQLKRLAGDAAAPEPVRQAAARLVVKVDAEHRVPHTESPVDDARLIVEFAEKQGAGG
jgi:hypothetical protein